MNIGHIFLWGSLFTGLSATQAAQAQQIQRSVVNPGFEANDPQGAGAPNFQIFGNGVVPGWDSTSGSIELWDSNFQGVPAVEGLVFAELNANSPGALFQNICMVNGEVIRWRFAHRARSGGQATQTVNFQVANSTGTLIQNLQTSAVTSTTAWAMRSNTIGTAYTGPTGVQRVQFLTPDPGSYGNFLDDISIDLTPYVELDPGSTSSREGAASPTLPAIRISGKFTSSVDFTVAVNGGTATLGSDYTTPTGTNAFIVTVPAGNYDSAAFPLGVTITQDNIGDSGETIQFTIAANPSAYTIASTRTCGGTPTLIATHTILDDQITAADDLAGNVDGVAGATAVINAFTNDILEGQAVVGTDVATTVLSPATPISGGPVPVLNTSSGAVDVPPGTPPGSYVIQYRICQLLEPANCATANITVTVRLVNVDLSIQKTNTFGQNSNNDLPTDSVYYGAATSYSLIVTNHGPYAVTGAIVSDTVGSHLNCPAGNNVTISGAGVPPGSYTISNLTSTGITLGTLANGGSAILTYSCQIN